MEDDVYARAVFVGTGAYTPSTTEKHRRIELAKAVNYDPAFAHRAQKHSGLACCTMQRSRQVCHITYPEGAGAYPWGTVRHCAAIFVVVGGLKRNRGELEHTQSTVGTLCLELLSYSYGPKFVCQGQGRSKARTTPLPRIPSMSNERA